MCGGSRATSGGVVGGGGDGRVISIDLASVNECVHTHVVRTRTWFERGSKCVCGGSRATSGGVVGGRGDGRVISIDLASVN